MPARAVIIIVLALGSSAGFGQDDPGYGPIDVVIDAEQRPRDFAHLVEGDTGYTGIITEAVVDGQSFDREACAIAAVKFQDGSVARYERDQMRARLQRVIDSHAEANFVKLLLTEGAWKNNVRPAPFTGASLTRFELPQSWMNIFDDVIATFDRDTVRERHGALRALRAQYADAIAELSRAREQREFFTAWLEQRLWALVEAEPDNATGYLAVADYKLEQDDLDGAFDVYQLALAAPVTTGAGEIHRRLGEYYRAQPFGGQARARAHFQAVGADSRLQYEVARSHRAQGQLSQAAELLTGLLRDPLVGVASRIDLGEILLERGELARAREALAPLDDPRAVVAHAEVDCAEERYQEALTRVQALPLVQDVQRQLDQFAEEQRRREREARRQGLPEAPEAPDPAAQPVPYHPLTARALRLMGFCQGMLEAPGRAVRAEAERWLRMAAAYDPLHSAEALVLLGRVFEHQAADGVVSKARAAYNEALRANPKHRFALYRLARLHERAADGQGWYPSPGAEWEEEFFDHQRAALNAQLDADGVRSALARVLLLDARENRTVIADPWSFTATALLLHRQVLTIDVHDVGALNALGVMAYREARLWTGALRRDLYDEAELYFAKSVSQDANPEQIEVWEFLGLIDLARYELARLAMPPAELEAVARPLFARARRRFEEAEKRGSPLASAGLAYLEYAAGHSQFAQARLRAVLERAAAGPVHDYAASWLAAIEKNETRMQWQDDFSRPADFSGEFGRKWDKSGLRESGLSVTRDAALARIVIEGAQGAEGAETRFYRIEDMDTFVGLDISLRLEEFDNLEVGLVIAARSKGEKDSGLLRFGLEAKEGRARFFQESGSPNSPKRDMIDLGAFPTDRPTPLRLMIDLEEPKPERWEAQLHWGIETTRAVGAPFAVPALKRTGADRDLVAGVFVINRAERQSVRVTVEHARVLHRPARRKK